MSFSKLTNSEVIANVHNYYGDRTSRVCKITPHHMAGVLTGEQCARLFQDPNRYASSNYCIGVNGDIVGCVPEEWASAASSSQWNDEQAITIEVSNDSGAPNWHISDASWNSLVNLCVDICERYNFTLTYDGTPNGSLTRHNMYAGTQCPGPYLQSRFQELADVVNARLVKPITYEEINRKSVILNKQCNLWNFNYTNWNDAQSIKSFNAGDRIDNIVAIATNALGAKYYVTEYSYNNGVTNGFNIVDCDDYVEKVDVPVEEPKQEVIDEPIEEPKTEVVEEPKKESALITFIKWLVDIIINCFRKE